MRKPNERLLLTMILLAGLGLLLAGCAERGGQEGPGQAMLADEDPVVTEADRALSASDKPMPLPAEPYPVADPDAPTPGSTLLDLDPEARRGGARTLPSNEPVALPEEPKPAK